MSRLCTRCLKDKDLSEFYNYKLSSGINHMCKECSKAKSLVYYHKNKSTISDKYYKKKMAFMIANPTLIPTTQNLFDEMVRTPQPPLIPPVSTVSIVSVEEEEEEEEEEAGPPKCGYCNRYHFKWQIEDMKTIEYLCCRHMESFEKNHESDIGIKYNGHYTLCKIIRAIDEKQSAVWYV